MWRGKLSDSFRTLAEWWGHGLKTVKLSSMYYQTVELSNSQACTAKLLSSQTLKHVLQKWWGKLSDSFRTLDRVVGGGHGLKLSSSWACAAKLSSSQILEHVLKNCWALKLSSMYCKSGEESYVIHLEHWIWRHGLKTVKLLNSWGCTAKLSSIQAV